MIKLNKCQQLNNNQLKQFYKKCQKDKLIAIDTEFYRVDTYYPKLCLIQLANTQQIILLDPIENKIDLGYLNKILNNTKIKKYHAARQDIEIFLIYLIKYQDQLLTHKYS